ncbi:MAG: PAS domain S-box protein [Planctomycetes bacterium]|nr:PAS domain S-box protein [Planctomycetota bacterium]NOG53448.1 GAF domain-containing protein [Planctomycetota bacterium]
MGEQRPSSDEGVRTESESLIPSESVNSDASPSDSLSQFFDMIPSIVLVLDAQGRIVRVNQAALQAGGYTQAEMVNRLFWEVLARPEDIEAARMGFESILAGRQSDRRPAFLRDNLGEDHLYSWHSRAVSNEQGDVQWVISTGIDINEERRVEQTLRRLTMTVSASIGDTFFRTLVTALAEALEMEYAFIGELIRPDLRRVRTIAVYRDGQFVDNFEFDLDGKPCSDVVARAFCIHESGIRSLFPGDALLDELGAESYVGIPLQDSGGRTTGIIAVVGRNPLRSRMMVEAMLSITAARASAELERRCAEDVQMRTNRALRTLSEVNRTIVHAEQEDELVETVCRSIVTEGNYHSAWIGLGQPSVAAPVPSSPEHLPVLQRGADSLQTRACYISSMAMLGPQQEIPCPTGGLCHDVDVISGSCLATSRHALRSYATGAEQIVQDVTVESDCEYLQEHGNNLRYRAMIALPLQHGSEKAGVLCVCAFEPHAFGPREAEVLTRLADELAYALSALRIRTDRERAESELSQRDEQLRQAQKLEAVGTLAGGMAHDFKNLLTAISGYTSLAKRTMAPDHPAVRSLELVEQAAAQADGIIKSLLTFCQKAPASKRPFDLAVLIAESVRFLRHVLPSRIEVREEVSCADGHGLWILGDQNQIKQVILNLAINARDAISRQGTVTLSAEEVASKSTENGLIRLVVRDTGSGMEEDVSKRIFDPFFTTKSPDMGTGLGLAVVHGIVQDHGGTIRVASTPDVGTEFFLAFPCYRGSKQGPGSPEAVEQDGAAATGALVGLGRTVHLLADDTLSTSIVAGELRAAGLVVRCIHDLSQASDLLDGASLLAHSGASAPIVVVDESWIWANPTLTRHITCLQQYIPTLVLADGKHRTGTGGGRQDESGSPAESAAALERAVTIPRPFRPSDLIDATARAVAQVQDQPPNNDSEMRDDS